MPVSSFDWKTTRNEEQQSICLSCLIPYVPTTRLFESFATFHTENELEECCLTLRDYEPEEIRPDGHAAIETVFAEQQEERKKLGKKPLRREPKTVEVNPDAGAAWVTSFTWRTHKLDNAKQIFHRFYDNGWPGHIKASAVTRDGNHLIELEGMFHDSDKPLSDKFKTLASSLATAATSPEIS